MAPKVCRKGAVRFANVSTGSWVLILEEGLFFQGSGPVRCLLYPESLAVSPALIGKEVGKSTGSLAAARQTEDGVQTSVRAAVLCLCWK